MDMRHLLEQATNLERRLTELEERLRKHESEGSAGGGAARVKVNGAGDITELKLAKELLAKGDVALLEQTLMAALRQATESSRRYREQQRAELTGGLKLPEF